MLVQCCWPMLPHRWGGCCHNIHRTSPECCLNVGPNIGVVSMSVPTLESEIVMKFTQFCLKVISSAVSNVGDQQCHNVHTTVLHCCSLEVFLHWASTLAQHWYWYNVHTTLWQSSHNVAWMSRQRCWHIVKCLQVNVLTTFGSNVATTMLQRCDKVGTSAESPVHL